ncbi:D-alanyl-D-alanine endopeptidase [Pseudomonas aeruginosa VRFPA09]|nr:D-alanyl-D-alanine endopeptidase [Pseudomonas aeruginosa VRFPA09]
MRNRLLSLVTLFLSLSVATAVSASPPPKAGLPLQQELASGSALVTDQNTGKVLYSRNPDLVVPIASITKLMTAMVVLDSKLPLDEVLPIAISETSEMRGVFSRVRVGSQISRRDMLLLALMSSENRAAASLAQNYPGGKNAFVKAMNAKAHALGMKNTRYVEPTGLSLHNVSTARDLTRLLVASRQYPLLSQWSTTPEKTVAFRHPNYTLGFRNTNHLINNKTWNIQLTKTGFTNEAGHCLVMRTTINRNPVNLVVLDAFGKYTHFADATRLRRWLETGQVTAIPAAAKAYRLQRDRERGLGQPVAQPGRTLIRREDRPDQKSTLPRPAFTAPRLALPSSRRFCEPRVGLVGRRAFCTLATLRINSARRSRASSRFCSWVRYCWALITTTPSPLMRWSFSASRRSL